MSQFDNNKYPRDFHVVKDEHDNETRIEPERNDDDYREETAAEYAPPAGLMGRREVIDDDVEDTRDADTEATGGRGIATFALALSIVSLLFLPVLFGAAGLILGFMAVNRDQKGLGYTAIVISAFSIIMSVFFAPFVT
ncbi:hypothetical protein ACERII_18770 [Evansella sp. AB-rgal1]|uniref:hypothetical protein n=1 Tax=Evansella sp. AB-rgal1 TaxID=3242696 RepID=UPI00359E76CB